MTPVRVVAVLAVALVSVVLRAEANAQERTDYCAITGRPASLVLIDRTSPYSTTGEARQGQRIASGVDVLLPTLQGGDRVTIATIERHRRLSEIVFDQCYPGCARDWNCPRATVDRHRNNFRRAIFAAVIPLLQNDEDQPNSDITGTIFQTVSARRYARLYIYSDMLENSQVLPWSRFSTAPPGENLSLARRSGFVPDLQGARVQVVGFGLSHSRHQPALTDEQDRNIREFWRLYFAAGGATVSYRTAITP